MKKYILAGWLIDGSGGPIQEKIVMEIDDGRIASIAPYWVGNGTKQSEIIDFSHCTILPPLVDSHVHLFMSGTTNIDVREKQLVADYGELQQAIKQHLHDLFSHGVLAARDGGDRSGAALRYKLEQGIPEEMIVRLAGRAWRREGRYGSLIGRSPGKKQTLAQAYLGEEEPSDHVKLVNSGLNSLKIYGKVTAPQFTKQEMSSLVRAAARRGHKVMVHANGREPVRLAIESGCHSIEHGYFMGKENLRLMADTGTFWVPTVFTMKAYGAQVNFIKTDADLRVIKKNIDHQLEQLAAARDLGVNVALGTDAGSLGVLHGESMVEEMKLYRQAGFSLQEIMQCATSKGAALLGLDDFGLLVKGQKATFLITRGSPAQLPRKLSYLEAIYVDGAPSKFYRKNPVKHVTKKS
ncbi:MAG: amidohydrolase family protein [Desulforhopalus sp.]